MNTQVDAIVEAMTRFASSTRDDRLSVHVARVAQRLRHQGNPFEKPLTRAEQRVIRPFLEQAKIAA
jgi:hypothetical protein